MPESIVGRRACGQGAGMCRIVIPVLLALAMQGCTGVDGFEGGTVVDTLPGGVVRVSNGDSGDWGADRHLTEILRVRGPSDADGFAQVAGLAIDESRRLWVLDNLYKRVFVFDSVGTMTLEIGTEGQGPGEIMDGIGLFRDAEGNVWLSDFGNQRYTEFDAEGRVSREVRRDVVGRPHAWRAREIPSRGYVEAGVGLWEQTDGTGRSASVAMSTAFRLDRAFGKVDSLPVALTIAEQERTLFEFPDGGFAFVPWRTEVLWEVDPSGEIWRAYSRPYEIVRLGFDGDTILIVRRDTPAPAVTPAERDSVVHEIEERRGFDLAGRVDYIPARKPHIAGLRVGETGHLWVRRALPASAHGSVFDVFDRDGRFCGAVTSDLVLREPIHVAEPYVAATVLDDLDVPAVVVLEISGRTDGAAPRASATPCAASRR